MIPYLIGGGTVVVLCIMLAAVRELFSYCRHQHLGFPINGRQICLDCTAWRPYCIGEHPGPWQRPKPARVTQ